MHPAVCPCGLYRIIEIEWAVKNGKPFNPSPKKPRKKGGRKTKKASASSKGSTTSTGEALLFADQDAEIEQENVGAPLKLSQKRRAGELQDDDDVFTTPSKKKKIEIDEADIDDAE